MKHPKTRVDWYEEVCQRLDALRKGAAEYADEGEVLPPSKLYDLVKKFLS